MASATPDRRLPTCGCNCTTPECTDCVNWAATAVSISGATNGNCPGVCGGINGTRAFRNVSDPIPVNCLWTVGGLAFANCQFDTPGDDVFVGLNCGGVASNSFSVFLTNSGSLYLVEVNIVMGYRHVFTPATGNFYQAIFSKTSATCAGLLGALTLNRTLDVAPGCTSLGDYCGVAGATVTLS